MSHESSPKQNAAKANVVAAMIIGAIRRVHRGAASSLPREGQRGQKTS
jgi:hypothetical protein